MSAGSFCKSPSMVMRTSPLDQSIPACRAAVWPKLRRSRTASSRGLRLSRSSLIGITTDKRIMDSLHALRKIAEEINARAKQAGGYEHREPEEGQAQGGRRGDTERRQEQHHASLTHAHAVEAN